MITIEDAEISNASEVLIIAKNTFSETFLEYNTKENLDLYLGQHLTFESIKKQLLNLKCHFYLAKFNGNVVGYLKVNFEESQTELQDSEAVEIERIYVLKSHHGQKIGQALMNKALEVAKKANLTYIWLGVWENNKIGIDFYTKNGFVTFDKHVFMIGNDVQNDFLMKLNI